MGCGQNFFFNREEEECGREGLGEEVLGIPHRTMASPDALGASGRLFLTATLSSQYLHFDKCPVQWLVLSSGLGGAWKSLGVVCERERGE